MVGRPISEELSVPFSKVRISVFEAMCRILAGSKVGNVCCKFLIVHLDREMKEILSVLACTTRESYDNLLA